MIEVKMPQLGESVAEGTITQWHVKAGDRVKSGQPLVEVATDKADSEVSSPSDGVVARLAAAEGDLVATGALLCVIDESAAGGSKNAADDSATAAPTEQAAEASDPSELQSALPRSSPSTRKLAREQGVDLRAVTGTGERGRITHGDVKQASQASAGETHVRKTAASTPPPAAPPGARPSSTGSFDLTPGPAQTASTLAQADEIAALMNAGRPQAGVGYRAYKVPAYRAEPGDEVVPFSRRRRITADHMVYSQAVSPHVVTVAEIDLFETAKLRDEHKGALKKEGVSLTFLAFVVASIVKALREHPSLNARVLDDSYALLKNINIGIAVDAPAGLLVANIKHTDQLSLRGIATAIGDLAGRARKGKVTADDLMGTTFTVSNPGRRGNLFGGAIISQPNVGILRIGEIKKRPVVVSHDGDDHIAIHPVMYAALSYDHRIVDGVEANAFLWRIADLLSRGEFEV